MSSKSNRYLQITKKTGALYVVFLLGVSVGLLLLHYILKPVEAEVGTLALSGTSVSVTGDVNAGGLVKQAGQTLIPAGVIVAYPGHTAPSGWIMAAGQSLARAGTYASLFAAICPQNPAGAVTAGTSTTCPYGTVDGSNFYVPDLRGRVATGSDDPDNTGESFSDAGRLNTSNILGNSGGEQLHTLTTGEMPSHSHGGATGTAGNHNHYIYDWHYHNHWHAHDGGGNAYTLCCGSTEGYEATTAGGDHSHSIAAEGGGASHNVKDPYQLVNYIIKY